MSVAASPACLNGKINCSGIIYIMDFAYWPILLPPLAITAPAEPRSSQDYVAAEKNQTLSDSAHVFCIIPSLK